MHVDAARVGNAPQHMQALDRANRVRVARADLKRRVAAGELDAGEIVLACPWMVESMALGELLISQARWGRMRCREFVRTVGLTESKTIGSLTERQRVTLAAVLSTKRLAV
jgi:hypothetical protein